MKLSLSEQEQRVMQSLSESTEGEVLLRYLQRLQRELTDTRNLPGKDDVNVEVDAANRASDIIEENLVQPLSRMQRHTGDYEPMD